ncbi:hypothetical protein Bca4012_103718 [Brassica carinata]
MYPNKASYKVIHPGLIGTMKKLCYSQTGKLESPDLKWDNFFMPTPMRFIQLPGDSPQLYVSKSSFLQSDSSWFDWNDEEAVLFPNWETGITRFETSYKVIHPGLIGTTKKLCYSQTGKLESPDLKWDNFFMPTPMRFIQLPGDSPPLYVSKSSFLQSDSSWFDWNDEEAVLFPNWETGITLFESGITSSCQLL